MIKLEHSIEDELTILEKYGLTPNELFSIKLILITQEGGQENYLFKFLQTAAGKDFRDILLSLQNKGVILKSYKIPGKGEEFDPEEIAVNKVFFKNLYKSSLDMGMELFEAYPMFTEINGATVALRGISKKFNCIEDFCRFYGKQIKFNPETHKEILDLINWEQDNNIGFICQSISSFVINQGWHELKALRDGKVANINFGAVTQI